MQRKACKHLLEVLDVSPSALTEKTLTPRATLAPADDGGEASYIRLASALEAEALGACKRERCCWHELTGVDAIV